MLHSVGSRRVTYFLRLTGIRMTILRCQKSSPVDASPTFELRIVSSR